MFECDNRRVSDLLSNALLYYTYLPLVVGSIVSESKPIISISTAEFILIQTLRQIKYSPFINTIVGALLLDRIPNTVKRAVQRDIGKELETFSSRWKIKLPIHYNLT